MKDHHVWLDQADIRRFLADLAAFEQTHGSAARLQSMSPDAFAFTLLPVDRLGHCAAELSVKWQSYLEGGRRYDNSLKFAFDVFADNIGRFRKEIEMELVGA